MAITNWLSITRTARQCVFRTVVRQLVGRVRSAQQSGLARSRKQLTGSVMVASAACVMSAVALAEPVDTVRMASAIGFSSFDPVLATPPTVDYLRPVYDTLVVRRGVDTFLPGLATAWRYKDENQVLELSLREGVTFSDGTPFDAAAVKANLERGKNEAGSPWATFYRAIEEIRTTGKLEVELVLTEPNPAIIEYLTTSPGMMVSPAALADPGKLVFAPVGTGGWIFDASDSVRGDHYTYIRNDNYWNPQEQPVNTVRVRQMLDAAARVNALRSKQVDIAAINPDQADALTELGFGVSPTSVVMRMVGVWDAEGSQVPALKNPQVRQAMRLAINRKAILKALFADRGSAGLNFYPPGVPGYSEELEELTSYDVKAARQLMEEAGYGGGFELETVVLAHHGRVADVIAGELAKIGIQLNVTVMPDAGSYFAAVRQKKSPLGIFAHQMALAPGMYHSLMSPKGRYNPFEITHKKLDALASQAARADQAAAQLLYADIFHSMIGEQALVFPVVNMDILAATAPGISFGEPTFTDAGLPNPRYLQFARH